MTGLGNGCAQSSRVLCTLLLGLGIAVALSLRAPGVAAQNQALESSQVTILVSRHIKPYMQALQGLRQGLQQRDLDPERVIVLEQEDLSPQDLSGESSELFVAIGPEALSFLEQLSGRQEVKGVYCMVLDPEQLTSDNDLLACGLRLSLPPYTQLQDIKRALPQAQKLGLLFNPEENQDFFRQASSVGALLDLQIKPLRVSSSQEISGVLQDNWQEMDALWIIPDSRVISKTLVQHIIKEAVYAGKPVIGYNRFFYESGAAVAYAFDYQEIGKRTAKLVESRLRGLPCSSARPAYELLINHKVLRRLGLQDQGSKP